MNISFIIPVLNEQDSLDKLTDEILASCRAFDLAIAEIIFIDDGSTDASWERIENLARHHGSVNGIKLSRNFGKAAALAAGFHHSSGDLICTMDADLQDDPQNIHRMLEKIDSGYDLVSGFRRLRQDKWLKRLSSKIFNTVVSTLTRTRLHDHNCGFKLMRRQVAEMINLYGEMHRFIPALAQSKGFKIGQAEVSHRSRIYGSSKYTPRRIAYAFFDLLTVIMLGHFRYRPLHFLGAVGMLSFGLGFLGFTYLAIEWMFTQNIGGRPLLHYSLAALTVGSQCIIGGILAEVMTAANAQQNAPYLIRTTTSPSTIIRRSA